MNTIPGRTGHRIALTGTLLSVCCLAYFYLLDRFLFSSGNFSLIFSYLLNVYDIKTAWVGVGVCLLAAFWKRPAPILRLTDWLAANPLKVVGVAVIVFAVATNAVYHNYPLCMDEYTAVFQSKLFAAGRIFANFPIGLLDWLIVPGFSGSFFVVSHESGHVIEGYWPGFAAILTPFQFLGVPWLCNPAMSGAALWLMYRITLDVTGVPRLAGWSMLFALASGGFLLNGISYYSMQAHLTANLLFAWLLLRPDRGRVLAAGFVGSVALVLHNPVPHALFALPWVVSMAVDREQRRWLPTLIAGYLPVALGVGVGWALLRLSLEPTGRAAAAANAAINGIFVWPNAAVLNMRAAATAKMWVWSAPGLLLFAFLGLRRCSDDRHIRLLALSAASTFIAYLFVNFDQGHGWGYRYFYSAWGVLPVMAASALGARRSDPAMVDTGLTAFAGAAAVLSLLVIVPYQAFQAEGFISRHLQELPPPTRPGNSVYFISPGGFYMGDMIQNDPQLRDQDLLLMSRGEALDSALIRSNWPGAVRKQWGYWGAQWTLGPTDRRVSSDEQVSGKHFVLRAP